LVLQQTTRMVPVVFVQVTDPLGSGFVSSMTHPGGNLTGFETFEFAMSGKWVEILKELKPDLTHAAIMHDPENPAWPGRLAAIEAASSSAGVQVIPTAIRDVADMERTFATLSGGPRSGLVVLPDNRPGIHRERIIDLSARYRVPAIYPFRYFVMNGGLMSYGVDLLEVYGAAATYVDRILKGAKPADLPVQAPTKFELVINLKTAKALGLDIPATLLARADEVIE
jgi:putative ABC transport system substrate-binding protein